MKKIVLFFSLFLFLKVAVAQEKVISDVKIKGTKRTKAWHLKKLINVEAGQTLDSLMLEKDMELLKRLPSIAHAYYQIFETEDAEYDVFYHIEENFTLIPFANIFSSSNDDFAFRVGLQEFNLLGRNITLGGFYQYDVYILSDSAFVLHTSLLKSLVWFLITKISQR
jgi:outer membrane protein assembly factor BamA